MTRPILVTGSHRSGTTWTGRMLSLSRQAGYMHEPFNPYRWPGWTSRRVPHWYVYITKEVEDEYQDLVKDVVSFKYPFFHHLLQVRHPRHLWRVASDAVHSVAYRARKLRPLIKDPIALLSAEWLAERFEMDVVVLIRHPAAFAGSLKKLNWQFHFEPWLAQPILLRDRFGPYEDRMRGHSKDKSADVIGQAILMWRLLHEVIDDYRRRQPGWVFVRHEDLAADPVGRFEHIYRHVGLNWDENVASRVRRYSSSSNPDEVPWWRHGSIKRNSAAAAGTWRHRLTEEETARIKQELADIAPRFYPDYEW
jgi:hypothetical protein